MEKIADLITEQKILARSSATSTITMKNPVKEMLQIPAWVDYLYEQFEQIYKSRWTQEFPSKGFERATKTQWAMERTLCTITTEELNRALHICRSDTQYDWPPSIQKFAALVFGIRKDIEKEREFKFLESALPAPKTDVDKELDEGADIARRIKDENPHLTWREVQHKYRGERGCKERSN